MSLDSRICGKGHPGVLRNCPWGKGLIIGDVMGGCSVASSQKGVIALSSLEFIGQVLDPQMQIMFASSSCSMRLCIMCVYVRLSLFLHPSVCPFNNSCLQFFRGEQKPKLGRTSYFVCICQQRRQSGLLSAWGSWIRIKQISIFPGKFPQNFDFSGNFKKIDFQAKIGHLQL